MLINNSPMCGWWYPVWVMSCKNDDVLCGWWCPVWVMCCKNDDVLCGRWCPVWVMSCFIFKTRDFFNLWFMYIFWYSWYFGGLMGSSVDLSCFRLSVIWHEFWQSETPSSTASLSPSAMSCFTSARGRFHSWLLGMIESHPYICWPTAGHCVHTQHSALNVSTLIMRCWISLYCLKVE